MNTAFAKAFTIDSLGSKSNIRVNGFYIEMLFFDLIKSVKGVSYCISEEKIELFYNENLVFKLYISERVKLDLKGLEVEVVLIKRFFIHKVFDGDDADTLLLID